MDKLSKAEKLIMDILWESGKLSNTEILDKVNESNWDRHFIKVYTKRLVEKGYLGVDKISPRKIKYYPLFTKEQHLAAKTKRYLQENYNGVSFMIAGLIDNQQISDEEIDELENLLKQYKER